MIELIHEAYRIIYSEGTREENIQKLRSTLKITPEIEYIIDFVQSSKRGIVR